MVKSLFSAQYGEAYPRLMGVRVSLRLEDDLSPGVRDQPRQQNETCLKKQFVLKLMRVAWK